MSKVKIYTSPKCGACKMAMEHLDSCGVPYKKVDLAKDKPTIKILEEVEFTRTPVLEFGGRKKTGV